MAAATIADRLREARERNGWTQEQVAEWAGIEGGGQAVSHYEAGRRTPSAENLRRLATGLRVSADWLLGMDAA